MVESYQATVEWSGPASLGTTLLAVSSRPGCSAKLNEENGKANLIVVVESSSLQALRDSIDDLLIALSDIEENNS